MRALPPKVRSVAAAVVLGCGLASDCVEQKVAGPERVAVASVSIVGPGDTLLWLGSSVQLGAVVKDAGGAVLTDRTVVWSTTNPSIGTVDQTGKVRALVLGAVTISAACEGKVATLDLTIAPAPVASLTIATPGDTTILEGSSVQLSAVLRDASGTVLTGRVVTWSSSDTTVLRTTLGGAVTAVKVGAATITATSEGVSGSVRLTVRPVPVAAVVVTTGGMVGLYVPGGAVQASATVMDSSGRALAGRTVTWSSSAPDVAGVDAAGLVTALSSGSVVITGTSGGASGSAALRVLASPVADWSAAAEWVTFQGNASHTGYVQATLNPRSFRKLWTTAVVLGEALNPVTASDGRVFVSTNAYFGATQRLAAVDAATGALLWFHDFGAIHGVHPPAAGSGRVYVTTSGQQDAYLYAFDAATGAQLYRSPYGNQWERYYAPVVVSGWVYMAGGYYGGMYRFDAATGAGSWFVATNQYDQWTPAVRDGLVYAYTGSYTPEVTAVDTGTGGVVFQIADPGFVWDGWSMNTAPVLGSVSDLLATQGSRLVAFDLAQHDVKWQLVGGYVGTVTVANGVLYVRNGGGVDARAESDGSLLWSWTPPGEDAAGTLVVTDNLLFVSTATRTYALDLGLHGAVWSYPAGGALALSSQGVLCIAGADGRVAAVAMR